jgi:SAM-dependent methyltransferase
MPDRVRFEDIVGTPYEQTTGHLLDVALRSEHRRLVDIGSGTGHLIAVARSRRPDLEVLAVEPEESYCEELRRRFGRSVTTIRSTAEEVGTVLQPASIDLAVLANAIHLVTDVPRFLAGAKRALRSGGSLAFSSAFVQGSERPDELATYVAILGAAMKALRRSGHRPDFTKRPPAAGGRSIEFYTDALESAGLSLERVEQVEVELRGSQLVDLIGHRMFAAGAIPGTDPDLAASALRTAITDYSARRGGDFTIHRRWTFITAVHT